MESLVFVLLTPLATLLMGVVGLVAWRRRESAGGRALVAFTLTGSAWLVVDALALLAPTEAATLRLVQATSVFGPLLGVAWLAFVLSYTGRLTRTGRHVVGGLTAWALVYGALALTNGAHRLVWASWAVVPDGAFSRVAYALGPLGWVQTVLAWTGIAVSLGVLLWDYAGTGARTRDLSRWIVAGALVPLALNVAFLVGIGPLAKDFTPIAMAVSSAAFAIGLARYRFLDLRPVARAALVDGLRDGMLVLDDQGRVADVNLALQAVLGAPGVALGRRLSETHPALARAIEAAPGETLRLGDGTRYLDLRISPLANRAGQPTGRLVLLHDVTHRRAEQAALHRVNADLHRANAELQAHNEDLDAFAHTVAHDLKNSIQGVLGWAEILRDDGPDLAPDLHREVADDVVEAALKMGTVVHELLLLAGVRQATVERVPVAMGAVVAEALARVRSARRTGLLPVVAPSHWPVALGHTPWVEEIWVNYLTNAAKYGGPAVTLGAETTAEGPARFWVHDDGAGISAEAQRDLFVPFSRVGPLRVEGHGLGLSIVRRIVDRLGGACGVESPPEGGTRFWFTLPCAPGDDARGTQGSPESSGALVAAA